MQHIAVIGAGITGVTTAYSLLQRGYRVTVVDRNRYAAMMTSFGFVNDWISPWGHTREIMHDVSHNVFPHSVVTSLRRNADGSVRKVNRWTGVMLRRRAHAFDEESTCS